MTMSNVAASRWRARLRSRWSPLPMGCARHRVVENRRVCRDMPGFGQDACGQRTMKMSAPFANSVVSVGLLWRGRSDEVRLESVVFVEGDGGIGAPALAPGGGSGVVRGERRFRRRAIGSGVWT